MEDLRTLMRNTEKDSFQAYYYIRNEGEEVSNCKPIELPHHCEILQK